ncbi:mitotic spindle checkpoint protein MAD1-like [Cornus florida]|uniref:mitotic spindle checkpoint protein MAD1-like n=1 Tax=Cornus florida TaxID=4283 RepID=UPI00289827F3|nr:mitotic spindle checkpoint protein MAD1-like [Cornus florida]
MIVRTPPPRKRRADSRAPESPNSDRRLVIYEDPPVPESCHDHSEQMLCTYQCRQMVKSEFLDALSNAEKQARDSKSKLELLNDDLCKAEAERKKYRDQFFYAEQEIAAAKGREQALQEQLLKEINDSQDRLKKQFESFSKLEVKLQNEENLRKKAESSAASAEQKASLLERKLSELSESIERDRKRLHNELVHLKKESELSVSRIRANLERMEFRATNAEKESMLLKEQLEELKEQLNQSWHQKSEVEKKLSSFLCQEVHPTDTNILVKHLQEELRNYESEVREARKLKSSHENVELLKEKLLEEKGRRERAESELLKLSDIQLSMKNLEDELSASKLMMKDIPGVSCADDIPIKFATLQKEVVESMVKMGEANARAKQLEVALDAAELCKQNAETEAALAKENAELSKSEVKRIGLMLSSAVEERDWLRNVVKELKKDKNVELSGEIVNGTLIQELESSVSKKECYIKELEGNLCELKEVNSRQHNEIKMLAERLNNEARRIKSLEREADRLRSEISLLESKLGHGDFSSANTKVLRMVNTLAVDNEAKQTIEALQSELQKTKEKLEAVEELKKQSADGGKFVDSYISGKIVQLKEQIATLEKREERYKTVFADRISVFRRACCELFGYKIVMDDHQRSDGIPVTRFTLQSIYAQSDDEKLQFEYESGNTNILANDYTSHPEISHQVDIFIRNLNSIPAFTANLTVESFNKRTLS